MLAVVILFLFLETYPGTWRILPAIFVPSSSVGAWDEADCLCFLIYSLPILKMTWPLYSSHQELPPITITFQGVRQWPSKDFGWLCQHQWMLHVWAPELVYVQLAKQCSAAHVSFAVQGLLSQHWALASSSLILHVWKTFLFPPG